MGLGGQSASLDPAPWTGIPGTPGLQQMSPGFQASSRAWALLLYITVSAIQRFTICVLSKQHLNLV